jgi:hypothetical protein
MTTSTGSHFFEGDEIGVGRAAVHGTIVGALVISGLVIAIGLYAGASLGDSLGMAAFAAFFGGPGLGGMLGAVMFLSRRHAAVSTLSPAPMADKADDGQRVLVPPVGRHDRSHRVVSKAHRVPVRAHARRSAPASDPTARKSCMGDRAALRQ